MIKWLSKIKITTKESDNFYHFRIIEFYLRTDEKLAIGKLVGETRIYLQRVEYQLGGDVAGTRRRRR